MGFATSLKGDVGMAQVIACLTSAGIFVALPMNQHLPFDLIAVRGADMRRVSVKYREKKEGCVTIPLFSAWSNAAGAHRSLVKSGDIDAVACWCPTTNTCYFAQWAEVEGRRGLRLRIDPSQDKRCKVATKFTDPNRMFEVLVEQERHTNTAKPSPQELESLILTGVTWKTVASAYSTSVKAVRAWAKQYGIPLTRRKPGRKKSLTAPKVGVPASRSRVPWPSDEELRVLVQQVPATAIAQKVGVSSVAVGKRCRQKGIPLPGRGYWAKKAAGK